VAFDVEVEVDVQVEVAFRLGPNEKRLRTLMNMRFSSISNLE